MRASEFLTEANLINLNAVRNNYLKLTAEHHMDGYPDLQAWLIRAGVRYIQQLPVDGDVIKPAERTMLDNPQIREECPWLEDAIERGDELALFAGGTPFHERVRGVMDWLMAQRANGARLNLDRMSFGQALEHAEQWHREMAERRASLPAGAEDESGLKEVMSYADGYRWVQIKSAEALQREGSIMQHCVGEGGYTSAVRSGRTKIYSLRDPRNQPHATVEVTKKQVEQLKGKQNKPPVEKYRPYIKSFLQSLNLPVTGGKRDLRGCGLVQREGGVIDTLRTSHEVLPLSGGVRAEFRTIENEVWLKVMDGQSVVTTCGVVEDGRPTHLSVQNRDFLLPLTVVNSVVEALNAAKAPPIWYHGGGYDTAGVLPVNGTWQAVDPSNAVATLSDGTAMVETVSDSGRWYHFARGDSLLRFCLSGTQASGWAIRLESAGTDKATEATRKPWVRRHLAEALNAIPPERRPVIDASQYSIYRGPDGTYGHVSEVSPTVAEWPNGVRMVLAQEDKNGWHGHERDYFIVDPAGHEARFRIMASEASGTNLAPYWVHYAGGDIAIFAHEIADGLNRLGQIGPRGYDTGDGAIQYLRPHGIVFDSDTKQWIVKPPENPFARWR